MMRPTRTIVTMTIAPVITHSWDHTSAVKVRPEEGHRIAGTAFAHERGSAAPTIRSWRWQAAGQTRSTRRISTAVPSAAPRPLLGADCRACGLVQRHVAEMAGLSSPHPYQATVRVL